MTRRNHTRYFTQIVSTARQETCLPSFPKKHLRVHGIFHGEGYRRLLQRRLRVPQRGLNLRVGNLVERVQSAMHIGDDLSRTSIEGDDSSVRCRSVRVL